MSIATQIQRIQTAKDGIKSAIEAKGVTVPSNAKLDTYGTYIQSIETGGGSGSDYEQMFRDLIEGDITSVTIPSGTTKIKDYAFYECTSLTDITIPDSVRNRIGEYSFYGCTSLESVAIPNGVTGIGTSAFYACRRLESVTIPSTIYSIGQDAFYDCRKIIGITIPNGVHNIGIRAFYGCNSLEEITIPDSVTSIGSSAFYGCTSLKSASLGNGVTTLGAQAFYECTSLTSLTIGSGITEIMNGIFHNCNVMEEINIKATTPPTLSLNGLDDSNNCPIYVPAESVATYKSATGWSAYASRIEANIFVDEGEETGGF